MKNVLITGAAGGLGTALVREYLTRGCRVFATDILPEETALARLPSCPERLSYFAADISDSASVRAMAYFVRERTNALDLLINGAGILRPESEALL